jgi:hypothetical protein
MCASLLPEILFDFGEIIEIVPAIHVVALNGQAPPQGSRFISALS